MSNANEGTRDVLSETAHMLANGLAGLARQVEPVLSELARHLEPLTRILETAAPYMLAVARGMERYDAAKDLLERGWVPSHTTPFDLIAECGDDGAKLQTSLLAYYTDNWGEVRARLETRLFSHSVDDEAKATFREALDAHEAGLYRCVSRVLFPEFERVFRATLFDGRAGSIRYNKFVEKLSGEDGNLDLGDFLIAGMQDMVLFGYLTESVREPGGSNDGSHSAAPEYVPGLAVGVYESNIERARQSPIPTRHAVAHGLVVYSSRQSSLNALFIADYVFSVVSLARLRQLGPLTDDNLLIFRDRTPKGRHYTERPGDPLTGLQDSSFGAGCFGNAKSS